jgi:CheY-like chemotaxis protein
VLIVEDQEAVLQLATVFLENFGYRVLQARNGPEAIDLASRYPEPIDLLLTDAVLPFMSGQVLADRLRRTRPEIGILCISGYAEARVGHSSSEGARSFLAKPFSRVALAAKVREVLADRGGSQR